MCMKEASDKYMYDISLLKEQNVDLGHLGQLPSGSMEYQPMSCLPGPESLGLLPTRTTPHRIRRTMIPSISPH